MESEKVYRVGSLILIGLLGILIVAISMNINDRFDVIEDALITINDESLATINEGIGNVNDNLIDASTRLESDNVLIYEHIDEVCK